LTIGIFAVLQFLDCFISGSRMGAVTWVFETLGLTAGIFLLLGLVTPLACALFCAASVGVLLFAPSAPYLPSGQTLLQRIAIAVAIALLGPGALSCDARLFGRREIIIPEPVGSPRPPH
jgi:uncharacterized membrane protein YphA (DoxX/SURF4 family)